MRAKTRKQAAG
jgi:adenylate kinase